MAVQYDRFRNTYPETTKQDATVLADQLWRLKVAVNRVQRIGLYHRAWRKHTIDDIMEKRGVLEKNIQKFRDSSPSYKKKDIQLGPLGETVKKLEDMADGIEYIRCKLRQDNCSKVLYRATNIISRLRLILKLRKAEELLKDLRVIIEDFNKVYKSEDASTSSNPQDQDNKNKTADHQSSAGQQKEVFIDVAGIKAQLLDQGGDTVIPFEVSRDTVTVYDIFQDQDIRNSFGSLLRVRASDDPVNSQGTLTESILKLMNSYVVNIDVPLHTEKCCKCIPCLKNEGRLHIKKEEGKEESEPGELRELRDKFYQLKDGQNKLLLVLEDVLEDQLPQLVHLLSAMKCVNSESRILLSTQSSEVMQSVRGIKIHDWEIKHDIHGKFFRMFAFGDAKEGEDEEMNSMAEAMTGYLKNFPLATKMVGKMLSKNHNPQFWAAILKKLSQAQAECERLQLSSLIKICYDELETPQRLCFQYCSLFPNKWKFASEKLVQLWMSQGFLDEALGSNNLEGVGNSYLEDLCSRSFFEKLTSDGPRSLHTLHASVHSFAQFTAGEEFMRIESHIIQPEKSQHIRHLSVKSTNLSAILNVDALYRLRTLIIFGPVSSDASQSLQHILPRLKNTRTLDLAGCDMKTFPELANDLKKHLRYLSIYDAEIHTLPDDLCEFLHLQVLNVEGSRLKKLPQKMTRLCNLRHISGPTFLTSAMRNIGKLKALQELQEFPVSKKHKIKELGSIKELGGSISITNLERVNCIQAAKARLHEKESLNSLKLEWSSTVMHSSSVCWYDTMGVKSRISAKVLESLKPSTGIHILEINRYIGSQYPSWFRGVFINLESITLRNCKNLVEPPPFGELLGLKTLKLDTWEKLTSFYIEAEHHFQKLTELSLEYMPELMDWKGYEIFSCLKLLTIRNCPKLRNIPLPESSVLEKIHLEDCQELSFAATQLPSTLLHLRITACGKSKEGSPTDNVTTSITEGSLSSLQTVHVDDISLLKSHYKQLVSLKELVIEGGIKDTLSCLPALRKLYLIKCQDVALPKDMKDFSSLKSLHLKQCNKMESLPDLPYSLVELRVDECPLLQTYCRENGPGWSNISHIPYKYI